jgi:hypothetical protein
MSIAFTMIHPPSCGMVRAVGAARAAGRRVQVGFSGPRHRRAAECNRAPRTSAAMSCHSSPSRRRALSALRPVRHRIAAASPACVKVMDTLINNTTSQISNTRASNRPPRRVKVSTMRSWNWGGSFIGAYLAPTAMATTIARGGYAVGGIGE